jgi:hypothetical protein
VNGIGDRREALARLVYSLRRRHDVVVERPDHPLLVDGPEVLAAADGRLAALFLATRREASSEHQLIDRLIASRLAYPPQTMCLLVQGPGDVSESTTLAFDGTVSPTDPTVPDRSDLAASRVAPGVRVEVSLREAFLYDLAFHLWAARGARRKIDVGDAPLEHVDRVRLEPEAYGGRRAWADVYIEQRTLVLRQQPGRNGSPVALLRGITRLGTRLSYRIDNGVVHLARLPGGVALVNRLPRSPGDPLKPLRAAAFAGWVLAERATEKEFDRLTGKIADRFPFQ